MRVISKGKATGKEFGKIKSKEKLKKMKERKEQINRIENAKKNAERRKEKELAIQEKELIKKVEIIDFVKNNFIILKEGITEKRVFKMHPKLNSENFEKMQSLITITVYGKEVYLKDINIKQEALDKLIFHIQSLL